MHSHKDSVYDVRKDVPELKSYAERSVSKPTLDVVRSTIQMKDQVNEQHDRQRKLVHDSKQSFKKQTLLLLFLLEENRKYQQYSAVSQKDTEASNLFMKLLCILLGIDE